MTSYDLHGGHRLAVALDSLTDYILIVTIARFIMDVEKQQERFTTVEFASSGSRHDLKKNVIAQVVVRVAVARWARR